MRIIKENLKILQRNVAIETDFFSSEFILLRKEVKSR